MRELFHLPLGEVFFHRIFALDVIPELIISWYFEAYQE
jgi:hypothetical protein